jgi:hypothetical protein
LLSSAESAGRGTPGAGLGAAASYGSSTPRRPAFRVGAAVARTAFAELALALTAGEGVGAALTAGAALPLGAALTAGKGALTLGTAAALALALAPTLGAAISAAPRPRSGALRSTITTTPPATSPSTAATIHAPRTRPTALGSVTARRASTPLRTLTFAVSTTGRAMPGTSRGAT